MDLLALYKNPEFNFQFVVHEALKAYVRGKPYFIYVPKCDKDLADYEFKSIYQFSIDLDAETEADVIEWIESAQNSYQNALIKSVLRGCLVGTSAFACVCDDNDRIKANSIIEMAKNKLVIYDAPAKRRRRTSKKVEIENSVSDDNGRILKDAQQDTASATSLTGIQSATLPANIQLNERACRDDKSISISGENKNTKNRGSDTAIPSIINTSTGLLQENEPDTKSLSTSTNQNNAPQIQTASTDDFDLSDFGLEGISENDNKIESDSFDLFGDITNMLKNF